jgi:DNA mismatch repair ATPase MutS
MLVSWITCLIIQNNTYCIMDTNHKIFIVGRSNAINIAERLGLPSIVIDTARKLYGSSSAEIDEVFLIYQTCSVC